MNNNTKWKIIVPILLAVSAAIGIGAGMFLGIRTAELNTIPNLFYNNGNNKISEILNIIDATYVEDINMDSITDDAITKFMTDLDPHSVYINKKDLVLVTQDMQGSFSGIGIQFEILHDTLIATAIIHGGPSEKAGIMPGDQIIGVDGKKFTGKQLTNEKAVSTLRGPKGSKVRLQVMRPGTSKPITFNLMRDDINVSSVETYYMITPEIGYINISQFGEKTYQEFLTAIYDLKKRHAKKFIIDLNGNPGGLLTAVIQSVNEFLPKDDLITFVEGRNYPREDTYADGTGTCQSAKIAVLIDEFSASAAEIFAGAIQDNDRGVIIGRRSFGKGLVQQEYPLSDSSAIRVTVAKYFTPSGRCIQKPYKKGDILSYEQDLIDRFKNGELTNKDSTDHKKHKAFKTKKGRTVYDGGGITPDIFIPRDTTMLTPYAMKIREKNLINEYSINYVTLNRTKLQSLKTWKSMSRYLTRSTLFHDFVNYAAKNGVKADNKAIVHSQDMIMESLTLRIAFLIDSKLYYEGYNANDPAIKAAIKQLSKK